MASRSYLTWSVPKLRAELATRGASVGGRITDLIERLKAYVRNRDFQPPPLKVTLPLYPSAGQCQVISSYRRNTKFSCQK
uniref:SAP domain-containing protein n=1 Tax=Magallana gigas TaxID=29159 RepID=A0A8W8NC20_MAGGI